MFFSFAEEKGKEIKLPSFDEEVMMRGSSDLEPVDCSLINSEDEKANKLCQSKTPPANIEAHRTGTPSYTDQNGMKYEPRYRPIRAPISN